MNEQMSAEDIDAELKWHLLQRERRRAGSRKLWFILFLLFLVLMYFSQ
jgi:hypothetical protein